VDSRANERSRAKVSVPATKDSGTVFVRLDRNESPFGPPEAAIKAAIIELARVHRYPEPECPELRTALSRYTGADEACLLIGNGSGEIIEIAARAVLSSGDEALIPTPTFSHYATACSAAGGRVVEIPRRPDFTLDHHGLIARLTPRTKIVFLANPNNPTGVVDAREVLVAILETRSPALIVVDECYFEYSGRTISDLVPRFSNLLVLRSFSKSFGLAGLRLGYAVANPQICDLLRGRAQRYSANRIAQAAAVAALNNIDDVRAMVAAVSAQRVWLECSLTGLGLRVMPSAASFVLINTEPIGLKASELVARLRDRGMAIADMSRTAGLGEYFARISIGLPHDMERLIAEIQAILRVDDYDVYAWGAGHVRS
jgi:histidinol-phosphate aminotransferase